jgi:hypothetical protein
MSNREIWKEVNWLDRSKVVELLESAGYACYDSEEDRDLRQALVDSIEAGEVSLP